MFPALAIIAASMFAKHMANQEAQDRQSSLQRSMDAYQRSQAQNNEKAINALIDKQTPDARKTELEGIQSSRDQSMQGTVDAARAASPITAAAGTNTSADYQKASASAADTISARTARAIKQLGVMGAPGEQGLASSIRFGRAAGTVDAGNSAIANVGRGYMTDINNVKPDPFLTMAGDVGMGVGSGLAVGGLGTPGATGFEGMQFGDSPETDGGAIPSIKSKLKTAFGAFGR